MATVRPGSLISTLLPFAFDRPWSEMQQRVIADGTGWEAVAWPCDEMVGSVHAFLEGAGSMTGACQWRLGDAALRSPKGIGAQASWQLDAKPAPLPVALLDVRLILFEVGIGFLQCDWHCGDADAAAWIEARRLLCARFGHLRCERRTGRDQFEAYRPTLLPAADADAGFSASQLHAAILDGVAERGWWDALAVPDSCLAYTALFVDGAGAGDEAWPYRLALGIAAEAEVPAADARRFAEGPDTCYLGQGQVVTTTLEGCSFWGADLPDTEFFRAELPELVRTRYWLIYLLAMHHRFGLLHLHQQTAQSWSTSVTDLDAVDFERGYRRFDALRQRFHRFVARGCFAELSYKHLRQRFHQHVASCFQLEMLTDRVYRELGEKASYLQMLMERQEQEEASRRGELFTIFATVIAVPSLLFGIFGVDTMNLTANRVTTFLMVSGSLLLLTLAICWLGIRYIQRRKRHAA